MNLKYKTKQGCFVTPCPYDRYDEIWRKIIMVGSSGCESCVYCGGTDTRLKVVDCLASVITVNKKEKKPKSLKDLLKPPFTHHDGFCAIYDSVKKITGNLHWSAFGDYLSNNEEWGLQQEFIDFLVDALNEKWERDFGELEEEKE